MEHLGTGSYPGLHNKFQDILGYVKPRLLKREKSTGASRIEGRQAERFVLQFPLAAVLECCGCYRHLVGISRNTCMEPSGILNMELGFQNVGN